MTLLSPPFAWPDGTLDRRRVVQCALSRVCGGCGRSLGRPIAFVGTEDGPFLVFRRRRFISWLSDAILEGRRYDAIVRDLIADRNRSIASAVKQQSDVTDEIAKSSVKIAGDGRLNAEDYKQCQKYHEDVHGLLSSLDKLVAQFKLGNAE